MILELQVNMLVHTVMRMRPQALRNEETQMTLIEQRHSVFPVQIQCAKYQKGHLFNSASR